MRPIARIYVCTAVCLVSLAAPLSPGSQERNPKRYLNPFGAVQSTQTHSATNPVKTPFVIPFADIPHSSSKHVHPTSTLVASTIHSTEPAHSTSKSTTPNSGAASHELTTRESATSTHDSFSTSTLALTTTSIAKATASETTEAVLSTSTPATLESIIEGNKSFWGDCVVC
ncbi:hypothetical protein DFH09DRAFT_1128054 [Mycena vulgaris]|nr:hypothetical protein DFH09DRAFT_1128054 [Mycena vulgaris]